MSPHGHWTYGRIENSANGSLPARGISLAKLGFALVTKSESLGPAAMAGNATEEPSFIAAEVTTDDPADTLRFRWR